MWDNSFGKVKSKKNVNPKPYDRPKSILSRVKDSVTGLLPQPSWLANWLHPNSPTQEATPDIESRTAVGPSESELLPSVQTRESFIFRRPGVNQNGIQGVLGTASLPTVQTEQQALDTPSTSQESSATLNFSITAPIIFVSSYKILIHSLPDDDDTHSESTSGCSSLLPHMDHKQESKDKSEEGFERNNRGQRAESLHESCRGRKTLNLNNYSLRDDLGAIAEERSSNMNEPGTISNSLLEKGDESFGCSLSKRSSPQPQPSIFTSKRPRFSITSFGPTIGEARKSLLSESIVDSPFYSGRTTYGGASAYRRASLQANVTSSPYARKRMHARPASVSACPSTSNTNTSSTVLSSSAQRIMQALEAMSTPVRDAKRIPTTSTTKSSLEDEDTSFTGFGLNRRRRPNLGPPATKLIVGTPVTVVSRPSITKPARTEGGIVSSTPISAQPSTGKIRSRVSAPVRESLRDSGRMRTDEDSIPDLPAVSMPIGLSNLPSFSLLPAPSSTPSTVTTSTKPTKTEPQAEVKTVKPAAISERPTFTFSAPIITVSPSAAASVSATKPPSFNFSSPLPVKSVVTKEPVKKSSTPVKPAEELNTNGSVLDVLGRDKTTDEVPSKVVTPTTQPTTTAFKGFGDKFKPPEDSWTCSICCVVNKNDKTKCAACETPKPGQAVSKPSTSLTASTSTTASLSGFGDKFKPAEDTWTCSVCCIVNKKDKNQCAACESPRPGQPKKSSPIQLLPPVTQGFGDKFKMASNQWECGVCMVRNSADDNQCKSCEEPRPGAKVASKAPAMPMFKFGAPQILEKTPVDTASKDTTVTISGQAEDSKKPAATTGFKFGTTLEAGSNAPTGGFKFGSSLTPATSAETPFKFGAVSGTAPVTGFSFGAKVDDSKKSTETKADQGIASAPASQEGSVNVLFKNDKSEEGKAGSAPSGFKFGVDTKRTESPASEASPAKKSMPAAFGMGAAAGDSTSTFKPSSMFSFGAPPAKAIAAGKEETPAITESAPSSTAAPAFSFGAPKEAPKPGFSFGKSAETTKEAPAFSFGAPTSTAVSKEEPAKPSGLFSFPPATIAPSTSISLQPTVTSSGNAAPSTQTTTTPVTSATLVAPATTSSSSLFSFGAAPSTSMPSTGLFSFGAQASVAGPAKTSTFSFSTPATSTTTSSASQPTQAFGAAPSQTSTSAPIAFGSSTVTTTSTSTLPFGSIQTPATSSGPSTFSFGSTSTPATSSGTPTTFSFGSAAAAPTTSAPSSLFSFGATTTAPPATTAAAPSTFSFGATAVPSTSAPFAFGATSSATSTPAFAFGAPASTTANASSGLFSFGPQPSAKPAATSTTSSGTVPFSFGAASTPASTAGTAPPFGSFGAGPAKTAPFSFNAPASSSGTLGSTPAFGDSAPKTTGLSFGATPAPAPPAFGSVPSNGFGGTSAPASTPFAFGAQSVVGAAQPPAFNATPSFNFGSSAPPAFGAQPTNPPASVFQFGNSTPSASPSFNFNAPPAYPGSDASAAAASGGFSAGFGANPFDITGGSGASNKRVMRKAVRRRP